MACLYLYRMSHISWTIDQQQKSSHKREIKIFSLSRLRGFTEFWETAVFFYFCVYMINYSFGIFAVICITKMNLKSWSLKPYYMFLYVWYISENTKLMRKKRQKHSRNDYRVRWVKITEIPEIEIEHTDKKHERPIPFEYPNLGQ